MTPAGGRPGDIRRRVAVIPDTTNNALLVACSDIDFEVVGDLIAALSQPIAIDETVVKGTAERWILRNAGEDWSHPVHIHLEEHQIVSRSGTPTMDKERLLIETSRKDVSVIDPGEELEIFLRFRDWTGRYPIHCHNTVHEDHAMMLRWEVVDP